GPLNVIYWRGPQRIVDVIRRRIFGINNIALVWDADDWRRQIDEKADRHGRSAIVVVDDDDFSSIRRASIAAQQAAALIAHGIDARAVRPLEKRHCLGTALLNMHVARLPPKPISVVVADNGASALLDNDSSRFLDHDAAALADLAAFAP